MPKRNDYAPASCLGFGFVRVGIIDLIPETVGRVRNSDIQRARVCMSGGHGIFVSVLQTTNINYP